MQTRENDCAPINQKHKPRQQGGGKVQRERESGQGVRGLKNSHILSGTERPLEVCVHSGKGEWEQRSFTAYH